MANEIIKIRFAVESKSEDKIPQGESSAIKDKSGKQVLNYLDMSLLRSVNGGETSKITDTNGNIIEVIVPYTIGENQNISVYRYHGTTAEKFTKLDARPESSLTDGTYYIGDDFIAIYADKFSTYAVGHTVPKTITFDANGGTVNIANAKTNGDGKLTSLPTPDKGEDYEFMGWYTAKEGGDKISTDTVFENDSTVYARWERKGGTSYTTYYRIVATAGKGGSISTGKYVSVSEGGSAGFTMTPDKGYKISDVMVDGVSVGAVSSYVFTNVKANHTIEVSFKLIGSHVNPATGLEFEDVSSSDWYYDDVYTAVQNGWFGGISDTHFNPDMGTTRGMIVTVLWRMENMPKGTKSMTFEDVSTGSYCYEAVKWGSENGIIKGYDAQNYMPDRTVSRQELSAILHRYMKFKGKDVSIGENTNILSYEDALTIGEWAVPSVQWACGAGLIKGSDNKIMPLDYALRGQTAAVIVRLNELLHK